jgi:hypothetical protein
MVAMLPVFERVLPQLILHLIHHFVVPPLQGEGLEKAIGYQLLAIS